MTYTNVNELFKAICNSVRNKRGTTEMINHQDIPREIDAIESGREDSLEALLTDSLVNYGSDKVTTVRFYGFFESCIEQVNFSNVTSVGECSFESCVNLTRADLPKLEYIDIYAFSNTENLESADFPKVTEIGDNAFYSSGIRTLSMPSLVTVGRGVCSACTKLEAVHVPLLTSVGEEMFYNCSVLEKVDAPSATTIGSSAFFNSGVKILILRNDSLCSLQASNVFNAGNPIGAGTGYIYVPKALISEYKTATNWVMFAEQIRAIEDYPDVCGGGDK